MFTVLSILHVAICVFLILVVLLQTGRGSEIGAIFGGGGSQTLFGASGPGTFLGKLTAVMAGLFMITSLSLAARVFEKPPKTFMEEPKPKAQQGAPATVPHQATTPKTKPEAEKGKK